jgi:aryl-alcohol dehydrogenase (NADP+)
VSTEPGEWNGTVTTSQGSKEILVQLDSYLTLGRSGLRVSPFALGAMTFGEDTGGAGTSVEESVSILQAYLDRGGNFIDTANFYTNGHAEAILGDYFGARPGLRDRVVLASKFFGNLWPGDPNGGGAGRKSILDQLHHTLRRMQTDYLDLYWLHGYDSHTPIEETMRVLDDVVASGKVRYIGFSNTPGWLTAKAQTMALLRGWTPLIALQVEYSLLARTLEGAIVPLALEEGLGLVPWSPLKNGFLSGKYRRGDTPADSKRSGYVGLPNDAEFTVIDAVTAIAEQVDSTPAAVSLAWLRQKPGVTSPIIGARRPAHLEGNLASLDLTLTPAQLATLDEVSAPSLDYPASAILGADMLQFGGASVDGVSRPAYPPILDMPVRY